MVKKVAAAILKPNKLKEPAMGESANSILFLIKAFTRNIPSNKVVMINSTRFLLAIIKLSKNGKIRLTSSKKPAMSRPAETFSLIDWKLGRGVIPGICTFSLNQI